MTDLLVAVEGDLDEEDVAAFEDHLTTGFYRDAAVDVQPIEPGAQPVRADGAGAPAPAQQVPARQELAAITRLWPVSARLTVLVGLAFVAVAFSHNVASAGGLALVTVGLALAGIGIEFARVEGFGDE